MAELGRPPVITPDVVLKLETAFARGLNITEACLFAGIARNTYYEYLKENKDFSDKLEELQENVKMHAKVNIADKIIDGKDVNTSQWLLERRDPDFKPKQESDHKGQITVNLVKFDDPDPLQVQPETVPAPLPQSETPLPDSGVAPEVGKE
jgi:hypothetical protein